MSAPSPATVVRIMNERKAAQSQSPSTVKRDFSQSPSSKKAKGPGTSSKSAAPRSSTRSSTDSSSEIKNRPTRSDSTQTKRPQPGEKPTEKKPFVRPEHLTQRLSSNEDLRAFRDQLTWSTSKKK